MSETKVPEPEMKTQFKITLSDPGTRLIHVYTTPEIAAQIKKYGEIFRLNGDLYTITIDARYVFEDVKSWLIATFENCQPG